LAGRVNSAGLRLGEHGWRSPPHIHRNEDETFYVLEGTPTFRLGDRTISVARLILELHPRGMEKFFEETLQRALDPMLDPPEPVDVVAARYAEAAPRHGLEFLVD
jgi:hypothetical protein